MGSYGNTPKDYDLYVSAQLNSREPIDITRLSKHKPNPEAPVNPNTDPVYFLRPAKEKAGPTAEQLTIAAIAVDRAFADQLLETVEHLEDRKRYGL